jgi:hypothetical protein
MSKRKEESIQNNNIYDPTLPEQTKELQFPSSNKENSPYTER